MKSFLKLMDAFGNQFSLKLFISKTMKRRTFKYVNHKPGLQLNQALMVFKFLPRSRLILLPCQPCLGADMLFSNLIMRKPRSETGDLPKVTNVCLGWGCIIFISLKNQSRVENHHLLVSCSEHQPQTHGFWAGPQGPMTSNSRLEQQVFVPVFLVNKTV